MADSNNKYLDLDGLAYLWDQIKAYVASSAGTDDYELLIHKPQINSVTLIGNKKGKQLYLIDAEDTISESEIDRILYGGLGE
jgi:hypothetical protein